MERNMKVSAPNECRVRLRSAPGLAAPTIMMCKPGTIVTVTDKSLRGWIKVITQDGTTGYMWKECLVDA